MRVWLAALTVAVFVLGSGGYASSQAPSAHVEALLAGGEAAFEKGDYGRAVASWQAALPALERAKDARLGDVLYDIGLAYGRLADLPAALKTYRRALAIYRASGNRAGEVRDLRNAGSAAEALGRYDDAAAAYRDLVPLDRANGDRAREAADLGELGIAEDHLGRYDEALASHGSALAIDRALENEVRVAADLGNIGNVQLDLGRYDDALASYRQSLAIHNAGQNRPGEALDLGNIGNVEFALGQYDEALASQRQALSIDRETGNRLGEATELGNIGIVEARLGQYPEALATQQSAAAIDRDLNDLGEAADLGNAGNVDEVLGRYDDALAAYEQALAIHGALDARREVAEDLGSIGNLEMDLGSYAGALDLYRASLAIDRAIGNAPGTATDLGNAGNAERRLGHADDALASERAALSIHTSIGSPLGEADDLANIGSIAEATGRHDDALASYRQALSIHRRLGDRIGESVDRSDIGNVQESLAQYTDALASAREAIAIDLQISNPEGLWHSEWIAARADVHLAHRDEALADYDATLDQIEALRAGLTGDERSQFFGNALGAFDEYIAYLLDLNGRFPGSGYDRKALEILERKSARAALEQIGRSAAQHFRGVDSKVVADETAADAAVDGTRRLLSKLQATAGTDPAALAAAQQRLADATARATALEASVKTQYPAYDELRHPQPLVVQCRRSPCPTIASFQQSVLRPGELVLAYAVLEGKSALWLIDRERVQLVPLAGSTEIAAAVTRLDAHVAAMLAPGVRAARIERNAAADLPAFAADGYALYRMLVPDAAAAAVARAKSLIVVPSGPLYRLAFETLVTRDPARDPQPHYLIEDVPVSYVPSASLLAVVRGSYGRAPAGRSPLLAFANPTFGAEPATVGQASGDPTYAGLQLAAVGGAAFTPLPGTQTEADAVRAALGAPAASVIAGDLATKQRVLELNANDSLKTYRFVLFATHAVLPSEIAGLTQPAIVLAHPERGDGLLTMGDGSVSRSTQISWRCRPATRACRRATRALKVSAG